MDHRMTGAVRVLKQGHGFIAGDDGNNYYLHWTAMRPDTIDFRNLRERERLDFKVVPNPRKDTVPRAVDVFVISADVVEGKTERGESGRGESEKEDRRTA